ncbi:MULTISPECIES: helix-turn-helix domain-containing protein [Corallococcus]|uniref:helix-turn-helix domain-containing protein n=1 Tax=Corallococcus TaxID=83461 RepID=UPI00118095B7|nr:MULTISPECIES: helix-turn-helix transcriptional regulator [Corallococcus]NBD12705.1 helix-turn-helix domain-containing protein [Corallococcus silvisoli]TSC23212.1 helix-turn-helix transcriptional regulator [Corallococcus sp. Z5C101001]
MPAPVNEKLNTVFGAAARDARIRLGLTQADVAERVGIAMEVYSRMERGRMLPRAQNLRRLCDVLAVSADVLLGVGQGPSPVSPRATPRQEDSLELRRLLRTLRELEPRELKAVARVVRTVVSVMPARPSAPGARKKTPAPGRKRRT